MTPMFTSPVEKTINQQLRDLEREKRALERAKQALKASSGPGKARKSPAQRGGKAGGKRVTRADQAFDWIKGHPGTTAAEISEAIGVSRPHAYQLANKLVGEEAISSDGGKYQARRSGAAKAAQEG